MSASSSKHHEHMRTRSVPITNNDHFLKMVPLLFILCALLLGETQSAAGFGNATNTSAAYRAEQTLGGLFDYYWKADKSHKQIQFVFACAQIGSPGSTASCTCAHPHSCVNCFRWWTGVALESVATYGIYANTSNHSSVPQTIFNHSPYNANWNATAACTFIDDFSWYGIAYLRVYEWLNDTKWLNRSIDLHDWAFEYGWDEPCGGFWWSNCEFYTFKDSIVTMEMLHLSSKLAYLLPDEKRFVNKATEIWEWIFSIDDGQGMMTDKFLVSTGVVPERCCNATSDEYTRCHNSKQSGTSYNQGLFMSAAVYLYLSTGNVTYLKTGIRAAEAVLANYTTKEGLLMDEPRSYQSYAYSCYAGSDPGGDWYSFNGIFMLHLGYFTDLLVKNDSMPKDLLERIKIMVKKTSDAAWTRSAVFPPFKTTTNVCHPGSSPVNTKVKVNYPKFHWWWGENVVKQKIPPDPRYYFHALQLRCVGNDTQIWDGMTGSELNCTLKCNEYSNCSKYLYQTYQDEVIGTDCWLWSYNRSDHICQENNYNFNTGIKRPIGNASCAGRCGSKEHLELINGTVCYCDENCSKHLDCCLDYADHCLIKEQMTCKGKCETTTPITPHVIQGGGYCWCHYGCNPWFTDNNSDGSCCPDYPQQCNQAEMPTCLDGRTQGSALNLFLGHMAVFMQN